MPNRESAKFREVHLNGSRKRSRDLDPIHSCPPEPFSEPAEIPPPEDTAQLATLWAEIMASKPEYVSLLIFLVKLILMKTRRSPLEVRGN